MIARLGGPGGRLPPAGGTGIFNQGGAAPRRREKECEVKRTMLYAMVALLAGVPALAQGEGKIGVFDSSIVFDRCQHGRALKADVERLRDLRLKEINDKQSQLAALQDEMRQKELTFNEEKRSEMLQAINQRQIELQRLNDDASREVQAEFNRAQQKLQKELLSVVDALGRDGNYTMIFEKSLTLYSSPDHDITGLVLTKFDEMFPYDPETGQAVAPAGD